MVIIIIVVVCIALMALFFGVTIAGGRAHDRQNAEREQRAERNRRKTDNVDCGPD